MGLKLSHKAGDTQLTPEELDMLIPTHVISRAQLDEVEQDNIEDAIQWLMAKKKIPLDKLLSRKFQNQLHDKMLAKVWGWAGKTRLRETNLGVDPLQIELQREELNRDAFYWIKNESFEPIELAIRYHHRLVKIHCYLNGNGRHSRIMADLILEYHYGIGPLNWKGGSYVEEREFRLEYIQALQSADRGDYTQLLKCAG